MSFLKQRRASFKYAIEGIVSAFRAETHMKIHLLAACAALTAAYLLRISANGWLAVGSCITLVFFSELMNTALEKLCDAVHPGQHPGIKAAKDISAGAVLVCCIFAVAVGLVVFLPPLLQLI
jgi:diacylglycerol kinase